MHKYEYNSVNEWIYNTCIFTHTMERNSVAETEGQRKRDGESQRECMRDRDKLKAGKTEWK